LTWFEASGIPLFLSLSYASRSRLSKIQNNAHHQVNKEMFRSQLHSFFKKTGKQKEENEDSMEEKLFMF
jgi:hypothetical protein